MSEKKVRNIFSIYSCMKLVIRFISLTLAGLSISICGYGQSMVIDMQPDGLTYYGSSVLHVNSRDELPKRVVKCLDTLLARRFGRLKSDLHFVKAQVVDLNNYFKDNDVTGYQWIVPKYDVQYYLSNTGIGLKRYNLRIRMDEYGQVLKINWPEEGFKSVQDFRDTTSVKDFVLEQAKKLNLQNDLYKIGFEYSERHGLIWLFDFRTNEKDPGNYTRLNIAADELKLLEVNSIKFSSVR